MECLLHSIGGSVNQQEKYRNSHFFTYWMVTFVVAIGVQKDAKTAEFLLISEDMTCKETQILLIAVVLERGCPPNTQE